MMSGIFLFFLMSIHFGFADPEPLDTVNLNINVSNKKNREQDSASDYADDNDNTGEIDAGGNTNDSAGNDNVTDSSGDEGSGDSGSGNEAQEAFYLHHINRINSPWPEPEPYPESETNHPRSFWRQREESTCYCDEKHYGHRYGILLQPNKCFCKYDIGRGFFHGRTKTIPVYCDCLPEHRISKSDGCICNINQEPVTKYAAVAPESLPKYLPLPRHRIWPQKPCTGYGCKR